MKSATTSGVRYRAGSNLVEQLLADRVEGDHAPGAGGLGDHGGAVGLDLGDREPDALRIGVLPPPTE